MGFPYLFWLIISWRASYIYICILPGTQLNRNNYKVSTCIYHFSHMTFNDCSLKCLCQAPQPWYHHFNVSVRVYYWGLAAQCGHVLEWALPNSNDLDPYFHYYKVAMNIHKLGYICHFLGLHLYMHAYMHTYMPTCIHTCIHNMHAYIHAWIHTTMHAYMHRYIHASEVR